LRCDQLTCLKSEQFSGLLDPSRSSADSPSPIGKITFWVWQRPALGCFARGSISRANCAVQTVVSLLAGAQAQARPHTAQRQVALKARIAGEQRREGKVRRPLEAEQRGQSAASEFLDCQR
jgi:hypothetical protein